MSARVFLQNISLNSVGICKRHRIQTCRAKVKKRAITRGDPHTRAHCQWNEKRPPIMTIERKNMNQISGTVHSWNPFLRFFLRCLFFKSHNYLVAWKNLLQKICVFGAARLQICMLNNEANNMEMRHSECKMKGNFGKEENIKLEEMSIEHRPWVTMQYFLFLKKYESLGIARVAGTNESNSMTAHPIMDLQWLWFTHQPRVSEHFCILTHKCHRHFFVRFLHRNAPLLMERFGRCITARRGSVRFICLCCSFLLSFAIFSRSTRLRTNGISRPCYLLCMYSAAVCKTAHFRTILSIEFLWIFLSFSRCCFCFCFVWCSFLLSFNVRLFFCVRTPASFILVIFCCCFPVLLNAIYLRSCSVEWKFSWILLHWTDFIELGMRDHSLCFPFSRCCLSVLNQMMMKKESISNLTLL